RRRPAQGSSRRRSVPGRSRLLPSGSDVEPSTYAAPLCGRAIWRKRPSWGGTEAGLMRALIQDRPLLLSSLIRHAAEWHAEAEVVSRTPEGDLHRYGYGEAERRARRLAAALAGLGLGVGEVAGSL